jgi:hypothetical protein
MFRTIVAATLALGLAACAVVTPYQPHSLTGGYKERLVGPNRWYVEFYGNGNTTRETVTAYWLYRCAELTQEKGFDYFVFISKTPPPGADAGPWHEDAVPARSRGGYVPIYTYMPGQTITTWSARAVIELRKGVPTFEEESRGHIAKELLAHLGPAVRQAISSGTNVTLPNGYTAGSVERQAPQERGAGPVKLDELDALLPKE